MDAYIAKIIAEITSITIINQGQQLLTDALKTLGTETKLTDDQKAQYSLQLIEAYIKQYLNVHTRLFKTPRVQLNLLPVVSTVAVENIHDWYLRKCHSMAGNMGTSNRGGIFCVYDEQGMGKTLAVQSLLLMEHGRAPKKALWFGIKGNDVMSGDEYYNLLARHTFCGGNAIGLSIEPESLAETILECVPSKRSDMDDVKSGYTTDIPGLRDFLVRHQSQNGRMPGGLPVTVFEDVNIINFPNSKKKEDLMSHMGKSHRFFGALMTQAYIDGNLIIVITKEKAVAEYFEALNNGQKSCVIFRSSSAQQSDFPSSNTFGWDEATRRVYAGRIYDRDGLTYEKRLLEYFARTTTNIRELADRVASEAIPGIGATSHSAAENTALCGLTENCVCM